MERSDTNVGRSAGKTKPNVERFTQDIRQTELFIERCTKRWLSILPMMANLHDRWKKEAGHSFFLLKAIRKNFDAGHRKTHLRFLPPLSWPYCRREGSAPPSLNKRPVRLPKACPAIRTGEPLFSQSSFFPLGHSAGQESSFNFGRESNPKSFPLPSFSAARKNRIR